MLGTFASPQQVHSLPRADARVSFVQAQNPPSGTLAAPPGSPGYKLLSRARGLVHGCKLLLGKCKVVSSVPDTHPPKEINK